jgi:hypothetical protein
VKKTSLLIAGAQDWISIPIHASNYSWILGCTKRDCIRHLRGISDQQIAEVLGYA